MRGKKIGKGAPHKETNVLNVYVGKKNEKRKYLGD